MSDPTLERVAVLADIHGNLPALEAVLQDLEDGSVSAIVCAGDTLWGPYQHECLAALRERHALFVAGNSERQVLAETDETHAWAARQLTEEERAFVASWPSDLTLSIAGLGRVLLVHASPRSDEEFLTVLTPDSVLEAALSGVDADVVVAGHTHQQLDRRAKTVRFVNAGSVGLPYEGKPGAFWALLGPGVKFHHTQYDVEAAAEVMRASGMPGIDELLPESLLDPLPPSEVARHFEGLRESNARGPSEGNS